MVWLLVYIPQCYPGILRPFQAFSKLGEPKEAQCNKLYDKILKRMSESYKI